MCNLDAAVISTLVNSVLPMELARDMQTHTQGEPKLLYPGPQERVSPLDDLQQHWWPGCSTCPVLSGEWCLVLKLFGLLQLQVENAWEGTFQSNGARLSSS